ncbi:MAG TPA: LysM domain-containing protein, partial [Acidimicrobiales bacterium]|nr:LysM domain-containing protein [Acidimicrobiales bacterium]
MAEASTAGWRHALLDVIGAALASVLAFVAVPAALVLVVGDPLAGGLGHTWPALPRDAMCTLTLAAWVAWVACCAQIARAVAAHVRRGEARARTSASFVDRVAARIAVGVLALMSVGAPTALPSTAGASPPPGGAARLATAAGPAARVAPAPPERPTPGVQRATTYEAQPGDTLWSVADAWLGDGADWTSIARHNLGRVMPDGGWFVDPDYLLAGWRLDLPVEGHGDERRVRNLEHLTHPRRSADAGRRGAGGSGRHLPELVALGMGSLACAALARQAALRRRVRPFGADLPGSALTDAAVDAAALVQRFDGLPALHAFEAANTMLGRALWSRSSHPSVRALCVGPSGVTFHLAEPDADPPEGFTAHSDATAWHVEHGSLDLSRPAGTSPPAVPVALPVGDDEEGTWLVGL